MAKKHIFIGGGVTNLTQAFRLLSSDPDARITLVDPRFIVEKGKFTLARDRARPQIFRFSESAKNQHFQDVGIPYNLLISSLRLREHANFQAGDLEIFDDENFEQIQIRDLQIFLLGRLQDEFADRIRFIAEPVVAPNEPGKCIVEKEVDDSQRVVLVTKGMGDEETTEHVLDIEENEDYEVHHAVGGMNDEARDMLRHQPRAMSGPDAPHSSVDVASFHMPQCHATLSYTFPRRKLPHQQDQVNFDTVEWQEALTAYNWRLMRPPRTRIFYVNDVLYVAAEIPTTLKRALEVAEATLKDLLTSSTATPAEIAAARSAVVAYKQRIQSYLEVITELSFPSLDLAAATDKRLTQFEIQRQEFGVAIHEQRRADGSHIRRVTARGDSRVLPHYQTGSGALVGLMLNELYFDIFHTPLQNFVGIYDLAVQKGIITHASAEKQAALEREYRKRAEANLGDDAEDTAIEYEMLRLFRIDVYCIGSRDIIEHNKEKVATYFRVLHEQTFDLFLRDHFRAFYRDANDGSNPIIISKHLKLVKAIEILQAADSKFLSKWLPKFIDIDPTLLRRHLFEELRDMLVESMKQYLTVLERKHQADARVISALRISRHEPTPELEHRNIAEDLRLFGDALRKLTAHKSAALFASQTQQSDELANLLAALAKKTPTEIRYERPLKEQYFDPDLLIQSPAAGDTDKPQGATLASALKAYLAAQERDARLLAKQGDIGLFKPNPLAAETIVPAKQRKTHKPGP